MRIIENLGVDGPTLSSALGIDFQAQPNPKTTYTIEQFDAILSFASQALKDQHIGIHISETFRFSTFPGPSESLAFCKDIEQAVLHTQKYASLVHNLGFARLMKSEETEKTEAKIIWTPNFDPSERETYRHITEYLVSNYVLSINWLAWGFGKGIKKVSFAHDPATPVETYEKTLLCPVEFGAANCEIILSDGLINLPLPTADDRKLVLLQSKLETILASQSGMSNIVFKVEKNIRESMEEYKPSIQMVASDLSMNERSLRRYLKNQETSFAEILERVKKELSLIYLAEERPYSEIAQLLWYSEQSAFTRAFKKWYGVSPNNYNP